MLATDPGLISELQSLDVPTIALTPHGIQQEAGSGRDEPVLLKSFDNGSKLIEGEQGKKGEAPGEPVLTKGVLTQQE